MNSSWNAHDEHTSKQIHMVKVSELTGYQEVRFLILFGVKIDLIRKALFVSGGHMKEYPEPVTYLIVISREIICLGFLILEMNIVGIDVLRKKTVTIC